MNATRQFIEARDQLLRLREDLDTAKREFRWPAFENFNWVRDYFDVIAADNEACALRMVDNAGADESVSYARMARRSRQVASFLAAHGVRRGDRLLIMLPNCVPLWETMLA